MAGLRREVYRVTVHTGLVGKLSCSTSRPTCWPGRPDPTFVGPSRILHEDLRK